MDTVTGVRTEEAYKNAVTSWRLALRWRHYNNAPVGSPPVVMPHALLCKCKTKRKGRWFFCTPLSDSDKDGN